jgi:hypothetical protein
MNQYISIPNYIKNKHALDYIRDEVLYKTGVDLRTAHDPINLDDMLAFLQETFIKTPETRGSIISDLPYQLNEIKELREQIKTINGMNDNVRSFCNDLGRTEKSFSEFDRLGTVDHSFIYQYFASLDGNEKSQQNIDLKKLRTISKDTVQKYFKSDDQEKELLRNLKAIIGNVSDKEYRELKAVFENLTTNEISECIDKENLIQDIPDWILNKDQPLLEAAKKIKFGLGDNVSELYKDVYKAIRILHQFDHLDPASIPQYETKVSNFVYSSNLSTPPAEREIFFKEICKIEGKYLAELDHLDPTKLKDLLQLDKSVLSINIEKLGTYKSLCKLVQGRFCNCSVTDLELLEEYFRLDDWHYELYKDYFSLLDITDAVIRKYSYLQTFEPEDIYAYIRMIESGMLEQFESLKQELLPKSNSGKPSQEIKVKVVRGKKLEEVDSDNNQSCIDNSLTFAKHNDLCGDSFFNNFYSQDILLDAYYTLKYHIAVDKPRIDNSLEEQELIEKVRKNKLFNSPIELGFSIKNHLVFAETLQRLVWNSYELLPWYKDNRRSGDTVLNLLEICNNDYSNFDLESFYLAEKIMGINLAIILTKCLEREDLYKQKFYHIILNLAKMPNLYGRIFLIENLYNYDTHNNKTMENEMIERIYYAAEGYASNTNNERYILMVKSLIYLLDQCYQSKDQMVKAVEDKLELEAGLSFINQQFKSYVSSELFGAVRDKPITRGAFTKIFKIINKIL